MVELQQWSCRGEQQWHRKSRHKSLDPLRENNKLPLSSTLFSMRTKFSAVMNAHGSFLQVSSWVASVGRFLPSDKARRKASSLVFRGIKDKLWGWALIRGGYLHRKQKRKVTKNCNKVIQSLSFLRLAGCSEIIWGCRRDGLNRVCLTHTVIW